MIKIRDDINLIDILKTAGCSSYWLRKNKILGESRIQRFRSGLLPSWKELNLICKLTGKSVGEIIEYVDSENNISMITQENRQEQIQMTYNNQTKTIREWSKELGISYGTLYQRHFYGWSDNDALTTPVLRRKTRRGE